MESFASMGNTMVSANYFFDILLSGVMSFVRSLQIISHMIIIEV